MAKQQARGYFKLAAAIIIAGVLVSGTLYFTVSESTKTITATPTNLLTITETATATTTATVTSVITQQATSSVTSPAPGEEPTSYTNKTIMAQEESTGLLNCTTQEEAFLNESGIYSELAYPKLTGNGDNAFNRLDPGYVYFVQFPNGTGLDVPLGDVQVPMIGVCQALGDAISHLGVNPQNYMLAAIFADDAELNIGGPTFDASWTFSFAAVDHGFWVDSPGDYTDSDGLGYAAEATVYAATGNTTGHVQAVSLPSTPLMLNLNSTQAVQVVRHIAKMNEGQVAVANGTVDSVELRVASIYTVQGGSYPTIQPVSNSTQSAQLRLVWIIETSMPNYVGFFVVDADSGQVLEAEGESTLPCGGASNCGTTTVNLRPVHAEPDYGLSKGVNVSTESFEVNGGPLGLNGNFSVDVPDVIIMAPGSSGSIALNFSGDPNAYSGGGSFTDTYYPSVGWIPSGISMNFSETTLPVPANQTATDTLSISIAPNTAQGTYIVFIGFPAPLAGYGFLPSGYLILSVWNGQGPWPVLPMLSVPLLDGQPQPIISNSTSTFEP